MLSRTSVDVHQTVSFQRRTGDIDNGPALFGERGARFIPTRSIPTSVIPTRAVPTSLIPTRAIPTPRPQPSIKRVWPTSPLERFAYAVM